MENTADFQEILLQLFVQVLTLSFMFIVLRQATVAVVVRTFFVSVKAIILCTCIGSDRLSCFAHQFSFSKATEVVAMAIEVVTKAVAEEATMTVEEVAEVRLKRIAVSVRCVIL